MVLKNHVAGTHQDVIGHAQRGFTLVESAVAVAVVAIAAGAVLSAMGEFARFSSQQAGPVRSAATLLAEQTLRVAENAWKYGSPGGTPSGSTQTAVSLLLPNGAATSAPVTLRTSVTSATTTSGQISVTVLYTPDPDRLQDTGNITLSANVQVKAPLPASTVAPAALIAQPANAP